MIKCNEGVDSRWAIFSMKVAVAAFVIVILKIWTDAMTWVVNTNVWWFVAIFVIFSIKAGMHCSGNCCLIKRMGKKPEKKVSKKKK